MKTKQETEFSNLKECVNEYLRLKKLGKKSVISIPEGKAKRANIIKKMAELAGYKD